ncbi:BTB/POZ domain-containing protein 9-like [Sitodiplosis mosellana]|uniref:BTB/POZ domain-containing protein 9-like n=1 Tax=Sitodiplosis mosellana TaxID=263140 RepID=UPI002444857D|nr:BTB/POZ domain-containing protein 9-like [Sitodiplosis mosellana]
MMFNEFESSDEIDQSGEILHLLNEICMTDEHADVTFVVENIKIPAHKTILSLRSPYFHSLIFGGFAEEKQAEIKLEVPLGAFKVILKYIYTGRLSLANLECEEIIAIYDLVNQYGFDTLKNTILKYLTINLTLENCVSILNAAHLYSLDDLQAACMKFMDFNSTELLEHDSFKELPSTSLCILLKRDTFYAPEIDIFKAICNWSTYNPDEYNIKEALTTVRSSELSSNDLLNIVLQSSILDRVQLSDLMKENSQNKTSRIPAFEKDVDVGVNFATTEYGAKTISGENPSALLSGNFTDYDSETGCTYHSFDPIFHSNFPIFHSNLNPMMISLEPEEIRLLSTDIIVDLGEVRFINYLKMLLMDKDSRLYSYYIDVSLDGTEYKRLFDHTKQYCRSWQFLYFKPRPVRFIKLIGTKAISIGQKREAYTGDGRICYNSFDIVGLEAIHKTTNLPELFDGVIKPTKNVAKIECGANVDKGFGGNKMLNENPLDFTCNEIGSSIVLRFNQPHYIGSLRMLLGNNMDHLNKYSFYIATSMSEGDWEMAVDKRAEYLSGWQEFDFAPRSAVCIKIAGNQKDVNLICTYFECPRNSQKPKLRRSPLKRKCEVNEN